MRTRFRKIDSQKRKPYHYLFQRLKIDFIRQFLRNLNAHYQKQKINSERIYYSIT